MRQTHTGMRAGVTAHHSCVSHAQCCLQCDGALALRIERMQQLAACNASASSRAHTMAVTVTARRSIMTGPCRPTLRVMELKRVPGRVTEPCAATGVSAARISRVHSAATHHEVHARAQRAVQPAVLEAGASKQRSNNRAIRQQPYGEAAGKRSCPRACGLWRARLSRWRRTLRVWPPRRSLQTD